MTLHKEHNKGTLEGFRHFLLHLQNNRSGDSEWHSEFRKWLLWLETETSAGRLRPEEVRVVWHEAAADALTVNTCQGYVCTKPRGYDGDFEIIERIYAHWRSPNPALTKWDDFFHAQAAPQAVRNRKRYFLDWLAAQETLTNGDGLRLLNVGSGPARDVFEHFTAHPESRVQVECVDSDADAISHAAALCAPFANRLQFHRTNALRFRPQGRFQLIWSGGLFDYLSDDLFIRLLRRLWSSLAPNGELVVGNFSPANLSRTYMELLGRWALIHRSETELTALASRCEVPLESIRVTAEPEGVNLFLHLQKKANDT